MCGGAADLVLPMIKIIISKGPDLTGADLTGKRAQPDSVGDRFHLKRGRQGETASYGGHEDAEVRCDRGNQNEMEERRLREWMAGPGIEECMNLKGETERQRASTAKKRVRMTHAKRFT